MKIIFSEKTLNRARNTCYLFAVQKNMNTFTALKKQPQGLVSQLPCGFNFL
jgi:hypothetical protein